MLYKNTNYILFWMQLIRVSTTVKRYATIQVVILHPYLTHAHNTIWLSSLYDIVHLIYGNINSTLADESREAPSTSMHLYLLYYKIQI